MKRTSKIYAHNTHIIGRVYHAAISTWTTVWHSIDIVCGMDREKSNIHSLCVCVLLNRSIIAKGKTRRLCVFGKALHIYCSRIGNGSNTHARTHTHTWANTRPQNLTLIVCECANEKQTVTFTLWSRFGFYFYIYTQHTHNILCTFFP